MNYNYCPNCGSKDLEKNNVELVVCQNCQLHLYNNPIPGVSIIIENADRQILLTTRNADPGAGKLDLPGGFLNIGETLDTAARRELREELGIEVRDLRFFKTYPNKYLYQNQVNDTLDLVLYTRIDAETASKIQPKDDVRGYLFVNPEEINFEAFAFEMSKQTIKDYLENKKARALKSDFEKLEF